MSSLTTNLSLLKAAGGDFVDVVVDIDNNLDTIDALVTSTAPTTSTPGDVGSAGSNVTRTARADHVHGRAEAYGVSGDLSTTAATNTASAGTSPNLARSDHRHPGAGEYDGTIATAQTTGSTSYTDLGTVGPIFTFTPPASGKVKVTVSGLLSNNTVNDGAAMGVTLSGGNTVAAADTQALQHTSATANAAVQASFTYILSGLALSSTTFTAKYRAVTGGTASFTNRTVIVEGI